MLCFGNCIPVFLSLVCCSCAIAWCLISPSVARRVALASWVGFLRCGCVGGSGGLSNKTIGTRAEDADRGLPGDGGTGCLRPGWAAASALSSSFSYFSSPFPSFLPFFFFLLSFLFLFSNSMGPPSLHVLIASCDASSPCQCTPGMLVSPQLLRNLCRYVLSSRLVARPNARNVESGNEK